MKQNLLKKLNERIEKRQLSIVITQIANGESHLCKDAGQAGELFPFLFQDIHNLLLKSKSSMLQYEGNDYFVSIYRPAPKIMIIGAVHITQALAPIARMTGFDVTIIDPRTFFASQERFPDEKLIADWPDEVFKNNPPDPFTAMITLTHDPKIDDIGLRHALLSDCFYIGALGSRKTHAKRLKRFMSDPDITQDMMKNIEAPIGLDIGSSTPAEIAVAIMASVINHWRKASSA